MTVAELKQWLSTLPPEFEQARIESVVHGLPCVAKRVVAYTYADGTAGLVVNSMGTHLDDDWWKEISAKSHVIFSP
jgi:hypothetical protein